MGPAGETIVAGQDNAGGSYDKRTLMQAMAWAEKQYHQSLLKSPQADAARRYLQERGISDESIERFQLGFSPPERDWILRHVQGDANQEKRARRAKILEAVGILARPAEGGSLYDRFKGRLLFSIRDAQGRPVGIGGRVLLELGVTSPAKYVNSPETPLFTKSKLLYGLDVARDALRKTRTALVMEGYTDVIVAHQYGFQNAVAVLGTALGESHIRLLKAHADRIVLVLDGDKAGTKRANEVLELFIAQQADLRILTLPEDLDPCDFLHKYGAAAFSDLLAAKAMDALDHAYAVTTRGIDVERDVHGVGQAIERLLGIVARAPASAATPGAMQDSGTEDRTAVGGQVSRGRAGVAAAVGGASAAPGRAAGCDPAGHSAGGQVGREAVRVDQSMATGSLGAGAGRARRASRQYAAGSAWIA